MALSSFSFITRSGSIEIEHMHKAFSELSEGSDRAAAIVGGAILEVSLQGAIIAHLHRNEKITKELFRTGGSIGAFSTKIDLGFLIGLYSKRGHRELETIKDIRNAFAHTLAVNDFKSPKIKSWTENLKLCERYATDSATAHKSRDKIIDYSKIPHRDWPHWIFVNNLQDALKNPRDRFLITIQIFNWAFSIPFTSAMPEPIF